MQLRVHVRRQEHVQWSSCQTMKFRGTFCPLNRGTLLYDQIPISESSSMFFGFKFEKSYYKYNSLPYGWRCSAFVTQALNNQICMWMRSKGHLIFIFIIISAKYREKQKILNLFQLTFSSSPSVSTILNPLVKDYFA